MGLTSGWFKSRLTSAKQNSEMQTGMAGIVEAMFINIVEPLLTRLSNRKSFFTMADSDLDTRINEMGQFFTIRASDASSKPMLLQQRLDEIHFKGTSRPITQTFYREFNGVPVTWQPLYAPVNVAEYAYGTRLIAENNLDAVSGAYGDLFLTSRGVISIPYSGLIAIIKSGKNPSINTVSEVTEEALTKFKQVAAPLLPLHIVFDGLQTLIDWEFSEPDDELVLVSMDTEAPGQTSEEYSDSLSLGGIESGTGPIVFEDSEVEAWSVAKFDNVRLDEWVLDVWNGLE